eukprot:scaffold652469_cov59-Prasinocladus_malaysianus.AAC.1
MAFSSLAVMGNSLLLQVDAERYARQTAALDANKAHAQNSMDQPDGNRNGRSQAAENGSSPLSAVKIAP